MAANIERNGHKPARSNRRSKWTVMVYLAGGDVALSVTISAVSTIVGVIATPLLVRLYVAHGIDVNVMGLLLSIVRIVLVPVALGVFVNVVAHGLVRRVEPILPLVSMAAILLIIAAVVAGTAGAIATVGPIVFLAVVLHNGIGYAGGYWGGRLLGFNESICRTLAFEVGMQNSGLAATLGKVYFTPLAALPGAIFSVWHNISGSLLAGYWNGRQPAPGEPAPVLTSPGAADAARAGKIVFDQPPGVLLGPGLSVVPTVKVR